MDSVGLLQGTASGLEMLSILDADKVANSCIFMPCFDDFVGTRNCKKK